MKTKIIIGLLAFTLMGVQKIEAQSFCYNEGDKIINIGFSPVTYGFGYSYRWGYYNNTRTTTFPALSASYQVGIHEFISVGAGIGRFSRTYKSTYNSYPGYVNEYKDKYSYTMVGGIAEAHLDNMLEALDVTSLNLGEQIDLYVGFNVGLLFRNWKSTDIWYTEEYNSSTNQWYYVKNENTSSGSDVGFYTRSYLGCRYMFKQNLGVFAEFGYAYFGYMNLGITLKP